MGSRRQLVGKHFYFIRLQSAQCDSVAIGRNNQCECFGFGLSDTNRGHYLRMVDFPNAANGPAGLAIDNAKNTLYVASEVNNEIFAITSPRTRGRTTTPGIVAYRSEEYTSELQSHVKLV